MENIGLPFFLSYTSKEIQSNSEPNQLTKNMANKHLKEKIILLDLYKKNSVYKNKFKKDFH